MHILAFGNGHFIDPLVRVVIRRVIRFCIVAGCPTHSKHTISVYHEDRVESTRIRHLRMDIRKN